MYIYIYIYIYSDSNTWCLNFLRNIMKSALTALSLCQGAKTITQIRLVD